MISHRWFGHHDQAVVLMEEFNNFFRIVCLLGCSHNQGCVIVEFLCDRVSCEPFAPRFGWSDHNVVIFKVAKVSTSYRTKVRRANPCYQICGELIAREPLNPKEREFKTTDVVLFFTCLPVV